MADHTKPTPDELEAGIKKSQEDLEKLEKETNPPPSIPAPSPSQPIPTPSKEIPKPTPSKEVPEAEKPQQDFKKRYTESTREAQVLFAKNRKIQEAIENAGQLAEPTEDEMKHEFTDWDEMTSVEQRLAKDNVWNKRKFDAINQAAQEGKNIDQWNQSVDTFIGDPKTLIANPELEGKEEEFKIFSTKQTRRGLDFEDLVLAFLGDSAKHKPAPKKGQMFEVGSGGPNESPKPKDDKLSPTEGRLLMKTNYKKYKEYLLAGKIRNE